MQIHRGRKSFRRKKASAKALRQSVPGLLGNSKRAELEDTQVIRAGTEEGS